KQDGDTRLRRPAATAATSAARRFLPVDLTAPSTSRRDLVWAMIPPRRRAQPRRASRAHGPAARGGGSGLAAAAADARIGHAGGAGLDVAGPVVFEAGVGGDLDGEVVPAG